LDAARSFTAREQAQLEQSGANMTGGSSQDTVFLAHRNRDAMLGETGTGWSKVSKQQQRPAVAAVAAARQGDDG